MSEQKKGEKLSLLTRDKKPNTVSQLTPAAKEQLQRGAVVSGNDNQDDKPVVENQSAAKKFFNMINPFN